MSKFDLTQTILDYAGKVIPNGADETNLDYRTVISNALNSVGDTPTPTEEKHQIFQLSQKIWSGKESDLTVAERTLIMAKVDKFYNALIFGRVCQLLDSK